MAGCHRHPLLHLHPKLQVAIRSSIPQGCHRHLIRTCLQTTSNSSPWNITQLHPPVTNFLFYKGKQSTGRDELDEVTHLHRKDSGFYPSLILNVRPMIAVFIINQEFVSSIPWRCCLPVRSIVDMHRVARVVALTLTVALTR